MKMLFLFLLPFSLICQNENMITGQVVDDKGQPLPYVNIGIVGTSLGTVSGMNGEFQFYFSEEIKNTDSLRFSMVGYKSQSFSFGDIKNTFSPNLKVQLTTASTTLNEIVVRPKFDRQKRAGINRKRYGMSNSFAISKKPNQNLGAEIGRRFRLPGKETALDTFRFFVSKNNFDTVRFRINIYDLKKGKPNKNILQQNIIVELTEQKTGWVKIDLTPYHLILKENIAMSVEWIYHSKKGKSLDLPIGMFSSAIHFYKYGSQGRWKIFPGMSTAMLLDVSY